MILLLDIGNTNTHIGLAGRERVLRQSEFSTSLWSSGSKSCLARFIGGSNVKGVALCSVVPHATSIARRSLKALCGRPVLELTPSTLRCVGIDYPKPWTIGPDRLANAAAVCCHFGAPSVVVDFGTAVTFDVVDRNRNYVGGIIAPGLAAMTDYLHEKTALLPRVSIAETNRSIGKSTVEAMRIGAVHGYRGLIHGLLSEVKSALNARKLPVVATGGCANLIASRLPEITAVDQLLTLEGLRLVWEAHQSEAEKA